MSNMDKWDAMKRPPATALKAIGAGRLKGKTDINPQWRLQVMTEQYGQCGVGWYYTIERCWTEPGHNGELMAFVLIHLHTKTTEGWSAPITGIGGSAIVAKESSGLYANDEGYKMATTDALSVAMKQLGVAADIYMGLWDGSKYKDPPKNEGNNPRLNEWNSMDDESKDYLSGIFRELLVVFNETKSAEKVVDFIESKRLDNEERSAFEYLLAQAKTDAGIKLTSDVKKIEKERNKKKLEAAKDPNLAGAM